MPVVWPERDAPGVVPGFVFREHRAEHIHHIDIAIEMIGLGEAVALAVIDAVRSYHLCRGTKRAELSWILEDNMPMRRMIEALGGVPYKTYRIYEKVLA